MPRKKKRGVRRGEKPETKAQRSAIMARVKGKNTGPELKVRCAVSALGLRYRLHDAKLPGKPDLVFARARKAIFVHGCFWHGHDCRAGKNRPASNLDYWSKKLSRNMERDRENLRALKNAGWRILIVWECEIRDARKLEKKLRRFLN